MDTIKIEHKARSYRKFSKERFMKEITCSQCQRKIRFMMAMPHFCPNCMRVISVPDDMFETQESRTKYHLES